MLRRSKSRAVSQKKPYTALWLGILLPGLGHAYAGDRRGAAQAFVAVTAMFVLGCYLAEHRVYAFSSSLFGTSPLANVPIHLLPEAGNFLETMIAWMVQPAVDAERARLLRLPVEAEHLGLALTGLSGVLNCILASDAAWVLAREQLEAERGRRFPGRPAVSVLLAFLLPGLGHIREGRRQVGLLVAVGVLGLYALGLYFSDFRGVDRAQLYWWWAAQSGAGGPTLLCTPLLAPLEIQDEASTMDLGVTLLSIAGLLNFASMTDVYALGQRNALRPLADDAGAGDAATATGGVSNAAGGASDASQATDSAQPSGGEEGA